MLSVSQITAATATACLVGVAVWAWLSEFPVADPGRPTTKAEPLVILEAAVPAIGDFSDFQVNDENPFLPSQLRQIESSAIRRPKVTPGIKAKPPTVEIPAQVLPRLTGSGSTAPAATGVVIAKGESLAMLTFPGSEHAEVVKIGESRHGWKVQAIEGGNRIILVEEATGATLPLAVTVNDDGQAADDGEPKASTTKDGTKKPTGKDGKDKNPGGKKSSDQPGKAKGKANPPSVPANNPADALKKTPQL
jgi:hypothetical protein